MDALELMALARAYGKQLTYFEPEDGSDTSPGRRGLHR